MTICVILKIFSDHALFVDKQSVAENTDISGKICVDNRRIAAGDIFVCIKGQKADGHNFIQDARSKNAALIVCEEQFTDTLPAIRVTDSRKATALLAKMYFHDPSTAFRLIGVTGTNGKTTTSMLLFKAIRELGYSAGWIGTLGYYIDDKHFATDNTTPDILELNQIFADMKDHGVKYVFMEVSSHALALDRVYGIEFDICLFTNLSREHLDFHLNMDDYAAAKKKLFLGAISHTGVALINIDDSFGNGLYSELKDKGAFVFSAGSSEADFQIRTDLPTYTSTWEQSRFTLQCLEGAINVRSSLIGKFNISNLALSASAMSLMGFEKRQIEQGLNSVQPVRGRFERVPNDKGIGVFVDYAHTPDALENVLRVCRELEHKRVLCLFGAGGERDKGKRPLMLKAALQYADAVIITDDNPRSENPDSIIRDIVTGSDIWLPWWIIRDRKEAIQAILRLAQPEDVVLLCGKGHETYQEIESRRLHFDDMEIAGDFFASANPNNQKEDTLALPVDRLMLEILNNLSYESKSGYSIPQTFYRISTDSRAIKPSSVFFALKGANYDGNNYVEAVIKDSSSLAVGQRPLSGNENYIQIPDPLAAMSSLCRKYLLMFDVYKIALTGSTGKSSTKELLAQVFTSQAPTLKTKANENNLIGLCKTVISIKPEHRYAIFELGTNAFGEIVCLSEVCAPDAGIIINIGPSHLEHLIDEDGVFKEKTALFNRPLDIRLYDADDNKFEPYRSNGKGVGFRELADFRIENVVCDNVKCNFTLNAESFEIPYPAAYYVKNAAFAIAMGLLKGISLKQIREALSMPISLDMRLQREIQGDRVLLIDCYNANPVSMQSAIEYWSKLEPDKKHVAILGDMLELGPAATSYHDMIAAILGEIGYDLLISVGDLAVRFHGQDSTLKSRHFSNVEDLMGSSVIKEIGNNAVVLIKGSHSVHLEKILPGLRGGA